MGTWGTAIKDNDTYADVYADFFERYNQGDQPGDISKHILNNNQDIVEIDAEKHNLWFALALAQWETKSLDPDVLNRVENIISSGADLQVWLDSGASEMDIASRRTALEKFLEKLKSDKAKAKARKHLTVKAPIFSTGDCLVFKLKNGNYGGAIVLATDFDPRTGYNLIAITRINQRIKPQTIDFKEAEILMMNFGNWDECPNVKWYIPDLYATKYADLCEVVGKITIEIAYDPKNAVGDGYLFKPMYTGDWDMSEPVGMQFAFETANPKSKEKLTVKQLIKPNQKWWKLW